MTPDPVPAEPSTAAPPSSRPVAGATAGGTADPAIALAAGQLLAAWGDAQPRPAVALSSEVDAYAVQQWVARRQGWLGDATPAHWKSGGPSREGPIRHAPLAPRGVQASPADGRAWPQRLRLIEAEVALRLGESVDAERLAAGGPWVLQGMAVSIELVESRWAEGVASPRLSALADALSHGALVLGEWQAFASRDWSAQICEVKIGERNWHFAGTHPFGDPVWGLDAWLAHVVQQHGTVPAGTVVTTGSWCGMLPAQPGDVVRVRFEGIGEAQLQL